ncbi:MAG: Peptidyl-tRNA hydrolase [Chlamydiia bacterium]|nr:Peptidyl-tRNA hydrolase [Chlamydiia bacterium]
MSKAPFLIVGLCNPGKQYNNTRHNFGAQVVVSLANSLGVELKKKAKFTAIVGKVDFEGEGGALMLPLTYMNLSGRSVKAYLKATGVEAQNVIVVSDDVSIPFGTIRFRNEGSCGGHNGLLSVEQELGTRSFCRLRFGVGQDITMDLADYVLAKFHPDEADQLPTLYDEGCQLLKEWIVNRDLKTN